MLIFCCTRIRYCPIYLYFWGCLKCVCTCEYIYLYVCTSYICTHPNTHIHICSYMLSWSCIVWGYICISILSIDNYENFCLVGFACVSMYYVYACSHVCTCVCAHTWKLKVEVGCSSITLLLILWGRDSQLNPELANRWVWLASLLSGSCLWFPGAEITERPPCASTIYVELLGSKLQSSHLPLNDLPSPREWTFLRAIIFFLQSFPSSLV